MVKIRCQRLNRSTVNHKVKNGKKNSVDENLVDVILMGIQNSSLRNHVCMLGLQQKSVSYEVSFHCIA